MFVLTLSGTDHFFDLKSLEIYFLGIFWIAEFDQIFLFWKIYIFRHSRSNILDFTNLKMLTIHLNSATRCT